MTPPGKGVPGGEGKAHSPPEDRYGLSGKQQKREKKRQGEEKRATKESTRGRMKLAVY